MGDQTGSDFPELALFGLWSCCPLTPLVALLAPLLGRRELEGLGPQFQSLGAWLHPPQEGRVGRHLGPPPHPRLGSEFEVDLSGSPCLKATSSQSDKRAARGRGGRKAWSGGEGAARAQCQHGRGQAAQLKWTMWLFPETRVNLGKSRHGAGGWGG